MPNNPTYVESERFSPTVDEMNNRLRCVVGERVYDFRYNEAFPYLPTEMELNDYDYYSRIRNPSCYNPFPIAIGHLRDRFLNIINANLREIGIE